jgi:RNA polymerase sigma-70 factor (sigma-E family)
LSSRRDAEFTEYAQARLSWLRGLAYVLCQDWHRADDVVQAALTRLYAHWGTARSADNQDGYARTILVREYLRERGSAWSRRVVLTREVPDSVAFDGTGGADLGLREALGRLPPGQRAVLVVRFYCDLSVDQAAAVLGCSPGTVKSQTAKGLTALRQWLDPGSPGVPAAGRRPSSLKGPEHG